MDFDYYLYLLTAFLIFLINPHNLMLLKCHLLLNI
jgi:hypothetical protein